jgi:hypothetical protein
MTARRLLTPVAKTLLDAAALIEARGWWDGKGKEKRGPDDTICADLAIGVAANGNFEAYVAAYAALLAFVGAVDVPTWNDAHSGPEVLAALRACAAEDCRS